MFEIQRPLTSANIPRTIRFHDDLFEELNRLAQSNNISFNALVLQCCQYALEHMPEKNGEQT